MRRARLDDSLINQGIIRRNKLRLINDTYKISAFSVGFLLFLMLVGIIAGISTFGMSGEAHHAYYGASIIKAILVSTTLNILLVAVSILCAIWIVGIIPLMIAILIKGFILGFSASAVIATGSGFLIFIVSIVIPNMVLLYAHFILSLVSISEWSKRFKNFFQNIAQTKSINVVYFQTIRPCLFAIAIGIVIEGVVAPILMRAIL